MKLFLKSTSLIGLGLTIIPAILVAAGSIPWTTHADLMAAGMVLWFVTAPFWMKKD